MRYLIDTHVLLWWYQQPDKLNDRALAIIGDKDNTIYVSDVVVWEIVIKQSLGKLKPKHNSFEEIEKDFDFLPIVRNHIFQINQLQFLHRDPFDRILIVQALVEEMPVITHDKQKEKYPIQIMKA